jgi:hypothetical protein
VRIPPEERARLEPTLEFLRSRREDVLRVLSVEGANSTARAAGSAAPPANSSTADDESGLDEHTRAGRLLSRVGVRLMDDGVFTIGIWSDKDSRELRDAIRLHHPDAMPRVRYLDGAGVPPRFKLRRVPGDPVPLSVLREMERNPEEPWVVRDLMLAAMRYCDRG